MLFKAPPLFKTTVETVLAVVVQAAVTLDVKKRARKAKQNVICVTSEQEIGEMGKEHPEMLHQVS